jgi:Domain of unknown function (DUF6791)/ThiF family
MSQRLISRSPDLQQLQDEGYEVDVRNGHLLIGHVPFLNAEGGVSYGTLGSTLQLSGDATAQPSDHVARFIGGIPQGGEIGKVIIDHSPQQVAEGLSTSCTFSSKPIGGAPYRDYHHKMTTYIAIVSAPAREVDPEATAITHPVIRDEGEESVFNYIDTASSRAGISAITDKLQAIGKVAIVGLGGTGSYILDFLAKTPVKEIHLFDKDGFYQHNAFRCPGAPSVDELEQKPSKVERFATLYAPMRGGIFPHDYFIDETNVEELREMDFVFIAADSGKAKSLLSTKLVEFGVPFIDVGMGLYEAGGTLGGQLRLTTATTEQHEHLRRRISFSDAAGDDPYAQNIQIAELNALNAALAVAKWKKLVGFYLDDEYEHNAIYVVGGNMIINDERAA